jgi:hypothetical protein
LDISDAERRFGDCVHYDEKKNSRLKTKVTCSTCTKKRKKINKSIKERFVHNETDTQEASIIKRAMTMAS